MAGKPLVAVAISLAAHAAVAVWLGSVRTPPRRSQAERAPVAIEVKTEEARATGRVATSTGFAPESIQKAVAPRGVTDVAAPSPVAPTTIAPAPAPADDSMLRMRSAGPLDLRAPSSLGDGPAPPIELPSGMLHPAPGGASEIHDPAATVDVAPDGEVTIHDAPDVEVHLQWPSARRIYRQFVDWYADPYAVKKLGDPRTMPTYTELGSGPTPYSDTTGRQSEGGAALQVLSAFLAPKLIGHADLTDIVMHAHGDDPYLARKRALLDATFDERAAQGEAFRDEQRAHVVEYVLRNLEALVGLPPAAQREAAFELWDDCAEGDDADGQAGELARRQVIGWIAGHLPAGSADAFTDEELAALNARRTSGAHFRPYSEATPTASP